MAIFSVNDIYVWVNTLANQYQSGQWSDTQFNEALKFCSVELLRSEIGLPESYQPGNPDPSIVWQLTNTISDDLRPFITPVNINQNTNQLFPYPSDYAAYSSIWFRWKLNPTCKCGQPKAKDRYCEVVTDDELRTRLTSGIKYPDFLFPIVVWYGGGFQVYPLEIKTIELTYLRFPVTPVWGFTILPDGQSKYDLGSSVQPDWPDTLIPNLAARICRYLAINIREDQLLKYIQERITAGQ